MANEYTLALKATLDTTEVQQKLDSFRSAQNSSSGNGSSLNNIGRLNQTLTKIENTLNSLNKSVDRLSTTMSKSVAPIASSSSRMPHAPAAQASAAASTAASVMLPMMSSTVVQQTLQQVMTKVPWLKSAAYASYRKSMFDAMRSDEGKWARMEIESDTSLISMGKLNWAHRMSTSGKAARILGPAFSAEAYAALMNQYSLTQNEMMNLARNRTPSTTSVSVNSLLQNRKFASIIGGQIFGAAGELASDYGYKLTGDYGFKGLGIGLKGIGSGFTAGGSAAYTAQLFGASEKAAGRIGLGVGIATSVVQIAKGLYEFRDALQQATTAQREYAKQQYERGFDLASSRRTFFDRVLAKNVLKVEDTRVAGKRLEESKIAAERESSAWKAMEDPASFARRVRERAETMKKDYSKRKSGFQWFSDKMSEMGYRLGVNDIANTDQAIDIAAGKVIEKYQEKFEKRGKQAQAAQQTADLWQSVVDSLKEARHKSEDALSRLRQEEGQRKSAVIQAAYEQADIFRANDRMKQSQVFALSIMRDRHMSPQAQFDKLASELDKVREQRNAKLQEAYSLNKSILLGKGTSAGNYEDMQRSRSKALAEAENLASRAGILENAIASIKNFAIPPDFSHMTSLAQYGFNMGEREDTEQVMEKYYSKITDLTQQIRDKLDKGITTTSTYD